MSSTKTETLQPKQLKKKRYKNKSLIQSYFLQLSFLDDSQEWIFFFFDAAYEFKVQLLPLLSEQRSLTLNGSRYVNTAGLIAWVAMKPHTEELDSGVT